ncbi:MAG: uroporphyrinogen decarboxylase family protein [Promethearchaeota archaeon]
MNARERLFKALEHEEPDRVPCYEMVIDNLEICNYFGEEYVFQGVVKTFSDTFKLCEMDIERHTATILTATESRSYIRNTMRKLVNLYAKIGLDLAQVPLSGFVMFPTICQEKSFIDEYGKIFDLVYNPSDNIDVIYYREGYFKTFDDYKTFPPLDPDSKRREKYFKIMKKVEAEKEGQVYIVPAIWGILESSWQAMGFVNFSKMMRNKKNIKELIDSRGKFALELTKRFIDWGEDTMILLYDDLGFKGGLQFNPKFLKEYVFPWYKQICNTAHKAGLKVLFHSCGDIYEVFEDLINASFDAIHPIEPTTANPEYNILNLKEKYGDKITLIGNISPQDLADKGVKYIEDYSKKLIKEVAPNGGYIFSSGHSINPAVKLENFLAMREIIKKYGSYPINI